MPRGDPDWTERGEGTYTSDEYDTEVEELSAAGIKITAATLSSGPPSVFSDASNHFADYLRNSYIGLFDKLCAAGRPNAALAMRQKFLEVITEYELEAAQQGQPTSSTSVEQKPATSIDLSEFFDDSFLPGGSQQQEQLNKLQETVANHAETLDTLRADLTVVQKQTATQKDRLDLESAKRIAQELNLKDLDVQLDSVQALLMQLTELRSRDEAQKADAKKAGANLSVVECAFCHEFGHQIPKCPTLAAILCPKCGQRGHTEKRCPRGWQGCQ